MKTNPETVPYRKKSYHSMVAPTVLARATFLIDMGGFCSALFKDVMAHSN